MASYAMVSLGYSFEYSAEKNALLKEMRGISFDEIIALIESGQYVEVRNHHNAERYPRQRILELEIKGYSYSVPCVISERRVFLKTIYPSRKRKTMSKKQEPYPYMDDEERDIIEAYKRGEFVEAEDADEVREILKEAARNYLKKDARINIRLSTADLMMLKRRAAEEGMPYQTLVASILHKYVSGRLGT